MLNPKRSHEQYLINIGKYLKGVVGKGLIMESSYDLQVNFYPDADFVGLYVYEDNQDPHCARSRTGYMITVANCLSFGRVN